MSTLDARAIVISETAAGENDKRITLLTKGRGKISVYGRGAKKASSKILPVCQLFSYADYVLYDGGNFASITSGSLIDSFYELRNDYDKLCVGNYILELVNKVVPLGTPCDDVMFLILCALTALKKSKAPPKLICVAFEIKFMQLGGYSPTMEGCTNCEGDLGNAYFYEDGLICESCAKVLSANQFPKAQKPIYAPPGVIKAIKYIEQSEVKRLFDFVITEECLISLDEIAKQFVCRHVDVVVKSRSFV
ncbi:MAG: DNA repair protein RecO [Defluviitaleaceae bacterium]|nr:DNA repair protein RecO [Defluviitaleaceae bacterium]